MELKIKGSTTQSVATSIGCYIFKEVRESEHNIEWLDCMCSFYQLLLSNQSSKDIVVPLDDNLKNDLKNMISKYLYAEAADYVDDDIEWLCSMISIYKQLSGNETKDAIKELKGKKIEEKEETKSKEKEPEIKEKPRGLFGKKNEQQKSEISWSSNEEIDDDFDLDEGLF